MRWFISSLLAVGVLVPIQAGQPVAPSLDFKEVRELIKSQLPGLDERALDEAAARGLVQELSPRVQLVSTNATPEASASDQTIRKTRVFDAAYGYVLFGQLGSGSPEAFLSAWQDLARSNTFKGLVLDLRFARGEDYQVAARLADPFFMTKELLLDWGKGPEYSEAKTNSIDLPLVVLINHQTAGAAEALAGVLRHGIAALLIGSPTAGQASVYRDFALTTGQHLRIATEPVRVGAEGVSITVDGLKPDLLVAVMPEREKAWLEDPYKALAASGRSGGTGEDPGEVGGGASVTPARRINEAELVRMLREGDFPDWSGEMLSRAAVPPRATVHDPALARALDFLKGLAVVRQFRGK